MTSASNPTTGLPALSFSPHRKISLTASAVQSSLPQNTAIGASIRLDFKPGHFPRIEWIRASNTLAVDSHHLKYRQCLRPRQPAGDVWVPSLDPNGPPLGVATMAGTFGQKSREAQGALHSRNPQRLS